MLLATAIDLADANPFDLPVDTSIRIHSTSYIPYQDKQYENSTATLNIGVILFSDHLDSICYSLDGQPLIYTSDFAVKEYTDYGRDKQNFFQFTATAKLENLSEGSHTITAYANDTHNAYAYINDLAAYYNFVVNSSYQVATPTLSPASTPQPL